MDNIVRSDELQHHGTKGMRWGIRRYQNKDGSLTPAGQKRYNKEVEKLKAETAKVKAAEKVAATRAKTQSKLDKLEAEKQKLEERKAALKKGKTPDDDAKKNPEETPEQRRERLLKSTDPKELYEGKDVLSYTELNDRINRMDLENKLMNRIPVEQTKTGVDRMNEWKTKIDSATNLYKSVDSAFSTVTNSAIGKTLAKTLGIEDLIGEKKKPFDLDDFVKNIDKKSAAEIKEVKERLSNEDSIVQERNKRANKAKADADYAAKLEAEKKAAKDAKARQKQAQKDVDDYNERWQKGDSDDRVTSTDSTYRKAGSDMPNSRHSTKTPLLGGSKSQQKPDDDVEYAQTDGKVYGEGTSKSSWGKSKNTRNSSSKNDTVIDIDFEEIDDDSRYSSGRSAVAGLLGGPTASSKLPSTTTASSSKKSESRTSQVDDDDYTARARKAAEELSKAAKKSSNIVDKVDSGEDIIQDILKRNDDRLNGRK